jgi:hypothetical protein
MKASWRAACIGGVVVLSAVLAAVSGVAQETASPPGPPAAASPPATPEAAPAPAPAASPDPDCKPADIACAWKHCNPLGSQWQSYHACIVESCHVDAQACQIDLIQDLNDPDRQKTGGQS